MSIRQMFPGSIVKPGFNPLAAPTPSYTYYLNSWGGNAQGQLGIGNTTYYSSPKQVGSLTNWSSIATGGTYHSHSIKTDGTLWSWGQNSNGQLGLGNTTARSSPTQVGALTSWLYVSGGYFHSLATKTDGTLWSWGLNSSSGQLGLGNMTDYSSPKQIGSGTTWSYAIGGGYFSMAIKTDGTLWSWGQNSSGQLGLGNTTSYSSPKQIGALTNWLTVSAGTYFAIAVKTNGTLWSWGSNNGFQLGQSTAYNINRSSPVQVGALTNWLSISCGLYHAGAVKTDGTLWSWGTNNVGQLGLGNTTSYSSPKQIGSLTGWSKVECGANNSSSIKTNGTLWTWGSNATGQLGLGDTTNRSSPNQVGALTTWYSVASGNNFSIALQY